MRKHVAVKHLLFVSSFWDHNLTCREYNYTMDDIVNLAFLKTTTSFFTQSHVNRIPSFDTLTAPRKYWRYLNWCRTASPAWAGGSLQGQSGECSGWLPGRRKVVSFTWNQKCCTCQTSRHASVRPAGAFAWPYLIFEALAQVHVEFLQAGGEQVVDGQNSVLSVEQAHRLWLARPPGHAVTHTQHRTNLLRPAALSQTVFNILGLPLLCCIWTLMSWPNSHRTSIFCSSWHWSSPAVGLYDVFHCRFDVYLTRLV